MAKASKNNSVIKNIVSEATPQAVVMKDDYSASIVFRQMPDGSGEALEINGEVVNKHGAYGWGGEMYRTNRAIYLNWFNNAKEPVLSHRVVVGGVHLFFIHGSYKNIVALVNTYGVDALWHALSNYDWQVYNAEKQTYNWNPEFKVKVGGKKSAVKPVVNVASPAMTVPNTQKAGRTKGGNAIAAKINLPKKPETVVEVEAPAVDNSEIDKAYEIYRGFFNPNGSKLDFLKWYAQQNS